MIYPQARVHPPFDAETTTVVTAKEFLELLVSRRQLVRIAGDVPRLFDTQAREMFVLDGTDLLSAQERDLIYSAG